MNWGENAATLAHWTKISQFRARHPAVGTCKQNTLSMKEEYGFSRQAGDDKIMVVWAGNP